MIYILFDLCDLIFLTNFIVINNYSVDTIIIDVLLRKTNSLLYTIQLPTNICFVLISTCFILKPKWYRPDQSSPSRTRRAAQNLGWLRIEKECLQLFNISLSAMELARRGLLPSFGPAKILKLSRPIYSLPGAGYTISLYSIK